MGKMKIVTVTVLLLLVFVCGNPIKTVVRKAKAGDMVTLPCLSEDKMHRFQYWQLYDDQLLGPWNNDDQAKIKYEIWSGRLIIKAASEKESGFYKCFSRHITGSETVVGTVELLIKGDWEESYENNTMVNVYRAVVGILVLLMLIMIGLFAFFIKRRKIIGFQDPKEDSPDDIPVTDSKAIYRSTSISMSRPSTSRTRSTEPRAYENAVVETDISTSFSLPN